MPHAQCTPAYIPTPDEIAAETRAIREARLAEMIGKEAPDHLTRKRQGNIRTIQPARNHRPLTEGV
jgi:hypothetical protein